MSRDISQLKTRQTGGLQSCTRTILCALLSALVFAPNSIWACAACYGKSDSPMAKGMNWGIASLLVVVATVLSAFATFFVYLAKKSAAVEASGSVENRSPVTNH